jgi:IPT/TIG domain
MSDIVIGSVTITGTGFTQESQVLFDGVPSGFNLLQGTDQIEANLPAPVPLGVHQISVHANARLSDGRADIKQTITSANGATRTRLAAFCFKPTILYGSVSYAVFSEFESSGCWAIHRIVSTGRELCSG